MKKVLFLLVVALILSLVSCGNENASENGSSAESGSGESAVSSSEAESSRDESSEESFENEETDSLIMGINSVYDFLSQQSLIVAGDYNALEYNLKAHLLELGEKYITGDLGYAFEAYGDNDDAVFCVSFSGIVGEREKIDKTFKYQGKTIAEIRAEVYLETDENGNPIDVDIVAQKKYNEAFDLYLHMCCLSEIEYLSEFGIVCAPLTNVKLGEDFWALFVGFATEEQIRNFECLSDRKYYIDIADPASIGYGGDNVQFFKHTD